MTNLKKPEEYLENIYITDDGEPNSVHDSVSSVVDMIEQAQQEAYNQAIDDAKNKAVVEVIDHEEINIKSLPPHDGEVVILPIYGVDIDSISKLKIK